MGNSFVVDLAELFGIVPRRGTAPVMVEKMIRQIALKNRNFVMWPEGTPDKGYGVMEGFSSIVKVYATLNSNRDKIPFVPVCMQVLSPIWGGKKRFPVKIIYTYLKPVFVPRMWLNPPEQGGKTPRFIIDKLMLLIAHKFGQKKLSINPSLHHRRSEAGTPWHG
jgi:1-acyl-sn-glycerol-3-phosphate acyltransferase